MRIIFAVFLIIIVYSCSGISEPKKIALSSDIAHDCMISIPRDSIPTDLYSIGNIVLSDQFPPFNKSLDVCGIKLIARDNISNEFMINIAKTISEIFAINNNTDQLLQRQVIENMYRYKTIIPLFYGEDWAIASSEEQEWEQTNAANSMCDIIMEDIPNQVMEVVEHILHHITDIGLHFTLADNWGLDPNSELYRVTNLAISSGNYNISQYSDISELDVRNRVILQEYAYWIIYTSWDLRKKYGPAESEWSIMTREEFISKEPAAFELFQNTIPKILSCPSDSMLNIFQL
tara:strand:+ start:345 stop:1214 length:870 start_codon:yes stop_codon:yes gene_type:complete